MIQIPNYTIKKVIGQGGMALVYLATQDMLSRDVALKVLMPDMMKDDTLRKSFLNEGKIVASLKHPNIVSIFDIGIVDDSIFYMTMEYISGGTLKEKLLKKSFSYHDSIKLLEEISEGLSYAHDKGYIHRDIKPANILFREDGSAVITDFGIAKLQDTSGDLTRQGLTAGTAQYMSPEQAKSSKLDSRSDIYSLGLVFFEILTGEKAFKFDTNYQAIQQHTTAPPPKLPKEYAFLQTVIDKVLAKTTKDRYQTTAELVQAARDAGLPTLNASTSTGNTIQTDKTIIHGTKSSLINAKKKKPYLLLASILMGIVLIGAIIIGATKYSNKNIKPDETAKVVNTIGQEATIKPESQTSPKVKTESLSTLKKENSSPECKGIVRINGIQVKGNDSCFNSKKATFDSKKVTLKPKSPANNFFKGCDKLSSLVKEELTITSNDDLFGMSISNSEGMPGMFCAQNDLFKQLNIYRNSLDKGDFERLDTFIYPPIKKGRSLKSLGEILLLPYLPSDNVISYSQVPLPPFKKYSKGIYVKISYIVVMTDDFATSQEFLEEMIRDNFLKEAQKSTIKTLKEKYGAFDIRFKKDTLEATFTKKGDGLAIYEINKGWSIITYNSKTFKKIKGDLPKKIAKDLTRFNEF